MFTAQDCADILAAPSWQQLRDVIVQHIGNEDKRSLASNRCRTCPVARYLNAITGQEWAVNLTSVYSRFSIENRAKLPQTAQTLISHIDFQSPNCGFHITFTE